MKSNYEHHADAKRQAEALAQKLGRMFWEPHVWSVGDWWHWAARTRDGWWYVHPYAHSGKVDSYTAYLATSNVGNNGGGRWAFSGKTPQEAVLTTLKAACVEADKLARVVKGAARVADSF